MKTDKYTELDFNFAIRNLITVRGTIILPPGWTNIPVGMCHSDHVSYHLTGWLRNAAFAESEKNYYGACKKILSPGIRQYIRDSRCITNTLDLLLKWESGEIMWDSPLSVRDLKLISVPLPNLPVVDCKLYWYGS